MNPKGLKEIRLLCRLVLLLSLCSSFSACSRSDMQAHKEPPPVPVSIAETVQQDTPFFLDAIGNVAALNTVDVKSRVTGELIRSFFKAGDYLTAGQEMFTIDPAPFEAKVKEAQAKLNQSRVQYEQARREYARFQVLYSEKAVSQEQLETKQVDMNSKLYQMELIQAELETARLNLGYCFIKCPLDGESGEIFIDNFNIVNANQDRLVTLKQIKPIKVKFSVPGKYLDQLRKYHAEGNVTVYVSGTSTEDLTAGRLTLIDNAINLKTGMIPLEATFENTDGKLWPGQFVRVRLELTVSKNAILVPQRSVNEGPQGQYVWVMNSDSTVAIKPVKIDRRNGEMVVLAGGLGAGERVITDGQLLLRPGAKVLVRSETQLKQVEKTPNMKTSESGS
ncbi:efflux RND transporter periplasmic adaptor subunit [Desulfomonile tiedjei]|uniref:RND family efflux transporter, MFP subunit n=1 Tax=Desulfomonile tiedjei (strain ATCC 49306 / DSM 6799 / DCB-1) TaxID=706587 RepID=I4C6Y6_DESTA|nr:efflux RND transporter periplasmic adaptor subunit [Desulfomonile tiedjei]AFM25327.1 RND family efflux transporter, MFP subunit [Desulfomonile tiedjei DSM 6799]